MVYAKVCNISEAKGLITVTLLLFISNTNSNTNKNNRLMLRSVLTLSLTFLQINEKFPG